MRRGKEVQREACLLLKVEAHKKAELELSADPCRRRLQAWQRVTSEGDVAAYALQRSLDVGLLDVEVENG